MRPEERIETKVCEYAEARGLQHRKLAWVGRKDAPDRLYWGPGVRPFMVEFKAPGEEPRPGQARELASLAAAGMHAYACDDIERGKQIIDIHVQQLKL